MHHWKRLILHLCIDLTAATTRFLGMKCGNQFDDAKEFQDKETTELWQNRLRLRHGAQWNILKSKRVRNREHKIIIFPDPSFAKISEIERRERF